jgi:hypothetical protein
MCTVTECQYMKKSELTDCTEVFVRSSSNSDRKGIILDQEQQNGQMGKGEWPVASSEGPFTFPFLHCGHANDHNVVLKLSHLAIRS